MYEIEYKVEINQEEKNSLISKLGQKGFSNIGTTIQNDYYIEAKDSPYGGYDLKRYRDETDKIIYTEKIWEMADDQPARRENESEVSRAVFDSEIIKFPEAIKIKKQREWFKNSYQDLDISLTIDSVKFDHSPNMRYFVEAETNSDDKYKVKKLKQTVVSLLKELLNKDELVEASGMFTMALKKK